MGSLVSRASETPAGLRAPAALLLVLYWLPVALACAWVLSLPVWPSQDGPLHLYYANILKQLLAHQPGPYADTYYIKSYITPYSAYYYGLVALSSFVTLETADKLVVCLYMVLFAASTRTLMRAVAGGRTWASFLCLPVLLNWPVVMGFLNYSLSTCLGFFALAAWIGSIGRHRWLPRAWFLLLICLMMVTHPVPWMVVVSFALLELALRWLRSRSERYRADARVPMQTFRLDLGTAVLACVPYLYLHHFKRVVQTLEPVHASHNARLVRLLPPAVLPFVERAQGFLRTFGLDVFVGGTPLPRMYRAGIVLLLLAAVVVALWSYFRNRRASQWTASKTWLLFSLLLLPFLLFLPDPLQDRYFFAARMGILFFVGLVAAAARALRRQVPGMVLAGFAYVLCLFTLGLAVKYITPAARTLATLQQAPAVGPPGTIGFTEQISGAGASPGLNFIPENWATAHYYRRNGYRIYNTSWLGDPIILVGVRPDALPQLDTTYFESVPWFGSVLLPDNPEAAAILRKVHFVVIMRQNASRNDNPFAENEGETEPAPYARGWNCAHGDAQQWYLCRPPGPDVR